MRHRPIGLLIAALVVCRLVAGPSSAQTVKPQDAFAEFASAWAKVNSYTCTMTAREVDGSKVQDRVYAMFFSKPRDTRMNVVGGDGRGSAAVWRGGETVSGHQGGILAMIHLTVNIHAHIATTIRGTTIADANWGAIHDHLTALKSTSITGETAKGTTIITAMVSDPASDNGVTREVVIFGTDWLPTEYDQYQGDQLVKRNVYSEVKVNVDIPASTWLI